MVLCRFRTFPKEPDGTVHPSSQTHTQGGGVIGVLAIQNEQVTGQWSVHFVHVSNASPKT